ncbi:MAG: cbb3-type cytochrome c oxidase subunit I [Candidatus Binatus sp.]|jgi:nitric oxide reductase subunit B|uniref:cbb3-type cytochrome c oxidase subunit I n=1 Tax=Candidatus Binatus sp. TaxID=2811406 RepID=UPI003D10AA37
MYRSQRLGLKYLTASTVMFGAMIVFGLLSSIYYILPGFLLNVFNFSTAKIVHIDGLVIWLLMGFIGAIYWFLPQELDREVEGIGLAELLFWVFCAAVTVVVLVFIFVQYGTASEWSMWFINQGRKYVEAPRWAAVGIVVVAATLAYNVVATTIKARRTTGILLVLIADLVPLLVLYFDAFPEMSNMSQDLFWWWWLVHLWVEATWEVLIGCIMAWTLIHMVGASRRVVESWLYVEVAMVLGTGILGLGHHYFWIGTPRYWLTIGGVFSAFEPIPLLGMVVHAVYDAGTHHLQAANRPAFYWTLAEAFGNFIGGGVWGFMMTLPQINMYSHGTQWTASHGHFAFWGAYGCGVIAVFYLALAKSRGCDGLDGRAWKWSFALLNVGMLGMVGALLVAGIDQAFFERAIGGSTWNAYLSMQGRPWFIEGMWARFVFGMVFACGYAVLAYDLIAIGRRQEVGAREAMAAAGS